MKTTRKPRRRWLVVDMPHTPENRELRKELRSRSGWRFYGNLPAAARRIAYRASVPATAVQHISRPELRALGWMFRPYPKRFRVRPRPKGLAASVRRVDMAKCPPDMSRLAFMRSQIEGR